MRDKGSRFVELAEKRVGKAIEQLRLIGNLSNRNNYEYSPAQVTKILGVLDAELKQLKSRFATEASRKAKSSFKL